jgi:hypothetical protein
VTPRDLLHAIATSVAGVLRGNLRVAEALDSVATWLLEECEWLDMDWNAPDYVPEALVSDR